MENFGNSENPPNLDLLYSIPPWLRKSKVPNGPERFADLDPNRTLHRRDTFKEMEFEDEEWHSLALVVETIKTYRQIQSFESKADPAIAMDQQNDKNSPRVYTTGHLKGQNVISPSTLDISKEIERRWSFEGQFEVKSVEELRGELEELRIQGQFERIENEAENQYLPSRSSLHDMTMRFAEARISNDLDFSRKSIESFMLKRKLEQNADQNDSSSQKMKQYSPANPRSLQYGFLWEVDSDGFPVYPEIENGGKFETSCDFKALPQPQPLSTTTPAGIFQQSLFYPIVTTTDTTTDTTTGTTTGTTTTSTEVYMTPQLQIDQENQARQNSNQIPLQTQIQIQDFGYFSEIEDL